VLCCVEVPCLLAAIAWKSTGPSERTKLHRYKLLRWMLAKAGKRSTPDLSSILLNHRPTAQARAQGTRDPVLRSLSISSKGKSVDLRGVLQGLQQHPRAMQLMSSVTELKLVGVVVVVGRCCGLTVGQCMSAEEMGAGGECQEIETSFRHYTALCKRRRSFLSP